MNKIILLVFGISMVAAMGSQVAFASTIVWPFYGESPVAGVVSPSLDAANNPDDANCPGNPHPPSCDFGIANDGLVLSVMYGTAYNNVPDPSIPIGITGDQIIVNCYVMAPDPTDPGFTGFTFGVGDIIPEFCRQNQRGDGDIGMGVEGAGLSNPDEIQNNELIVLDLNDLVDGGYTDAMFILSSHTSDHLAWVATSNKGPTGTVTPGDLTLLGAANDGLYPGSAQGTGNNDVYLSFPLQRYMYFKDATVSDASGLDFLVQQIKADMPMIGGSGVPIEQSALLVSGMKTTGSYMIPILMAAAGFGILIARRF